ncbi:MAG TPA: hypothetical protein VFI05_04635 [Nitrospiraceae bacterium]|nr:hypothetical protein [Nitrospiraceae bacterium]
MKFAVIVLTVEEMMDSEGLSCNEGIETIRAFVRDSLGDAVPDEFTDTIRRLGLISDERMPCEHIV